MRYQYSVLFWLTIPPLVLLSVGMSKSSAPINRRCELLAGATKSGSDLTIEGDAAGVAVGGNVRFADRVAVARGVEQLRAAGRSVCTIHRVRSGRGEADPTVAALFKFLGRLHGGESASLIWGGGGITVAGWLHDDALVDLRRTADPRWPLDAGSSLRRCEGKKGSSRGHTHHAPLHRNGPVGAVLRRPRGATLPTTTGAVGDGTSRWSFRSAMSSGRARDHRPGVSPSPTCPPARPSTPTSTSR